jgi:hypothetical protein
MRCFRPPDRGEGMTTDKTSPGPQHNDEIERLKAENANLRHKLETSEVFEAMFKNHRDELLTIPLCQGH